MYIVLPEDFEGTRNEAFFVGYNLAKNHYLRVIKCVRANERVRELKSNNVIRLSKVKAYGY
jgi:hypothetical protein